MALGVMIPIDILVLLRDLEKPLLRELKKLLMTEFGAAMSMIY
jgi:hypothetical protein